MTQPTFKGYPDWVRRRARSTTIYLDDSSLAVPDLFTNLLTTYVGDVAYIGIVAADTGGAGVSLVFEYRDGSGIGAGLLGRYQMFLRENADIEWSFPVRGPFLHLSGFGRAGATAVRIRVFEASSAGSLTTGAFASPALVREPAQTIAGGGGFVSFDTELCWPGWAIWQVASLNRQPFRATLDQNRGGGDIERLYHATVDCENELHRLVALPLTTMRITVFNDDSSSGDFDISLVAHSGIDE